MTATHLYCKAVEIVELSSDKNIDDLEAICRHEFGRWLDDASIRKTDVKKMLGYD